MDNRIVKISCFVLIAAIFIFGSFFGSSRTEDKLIPARQLVWVFFTFILFMIVTIRLAAKPQSVNIADYVKRPVFVFMIFFLAANIFSYNGAINRSESLYEIQRLFLMMTFIMLIWLSDIKSILFERLFVLITLGSVAIAFYELNIRSVDASYGTMGSKNLFAAAMMFTLPLCIKNAFTDRKLYRVFSWIAVLTALVVFVFLRARSVYAGMVLGIMTVILMTKKYRVPILCAVVVMGSAVAIYNGKEVMNTISISNRMKIWKYSLVMFNENKIFGIGAGNWKLKILNAGADLEIPGSYEKSTYKSSHNDYVGVLAETGLIGFISYVAIFVAALHQAVKRKNIAIASALVGYMTVAFFSFPKDRAYHTIVLCLLLAMSYEGCVGRKKKFNPRPVARYLTALTVFVFLYLTLFCFCCRYRSECSVKRMRDNPANWKMHLWERRNYSRFCTLNTYCTPLHFYYGVANVKLGNIREGLNDFLIARKHSPSDAYVLTNLGNCFSKLEQQAKASWCFREAARLHPEIELISNNMKIYESSRNFQLLCDSIGNKILK